MKYTLQEVSDGLMYRTKTPEQWAVIERNAELVKTDPNYDEKMTVREYTDACDWNRKTEQEWAHIEEMATIIPNVGDELYYEGVIVGAFIRIKGMNHVMVVAQNFGYNLQVIVPFDQLDMSYDDKGKIHYYCTAYTPGIVVKTL